MVVLLCGEREKKKRGHTPVVSQGGITHISLFLFSDLLLAGVIVYIIFMVQPLQNDSTSTSL